MLCRSQIPVPQVVQGAEQADPAGGRVAGHPAGAGVVQANVPSDAHAQVPSGYRQVRPAFAAAQAADLASAKEPGHPDGSMVGQPGPPIAGCTIHPDEGSQ